MTMTETQVTRTNSIGIYIDRVDRNRILATLKAYNAIVESSDSTNQLAVQLFGIYDRLPNQNKIRCTKCKGVASRELDVCPFCGHDEGDDLPDVPEVGVVAGNGEGSNHEAHMTEMPEGIVKVKKKKKAAAHGAESNGASVVDADLTPSSELRTERELDQAVANVEKFKIDSASTYWLMGVQIADIHKNQLWKLRVEVNEKGKVKPRWSTWESFCNAELKMTPKSANASMDVVKNFTEDQVRLWGRSKLNLVLQAPPEARPQLIEKIKEGASHREVEKEVRKGKAEADFTRPSRGARGGKTSASQAKQSTKIMVANILGSVTVKAYKKPASLKDVDWKEQARAKKLADQPIGVLELTNDVSMFIMLTESAAGELQYKVLTKRNAE
jgi:hypothetical protein